MVIRYFTLFFCIFLKHRRVELSFQCRNEFCMPKYPNDRIFMGFGEKSSFSLNFCPYYSMTIWRLWAKKLINTILAEFDFFPSKNHNSIVFYAIPQVTFRENHKKQKIIIRFFILFFCIFLKNRRVELNFQCRNEFCMPKYPNNRIFMGFEEKRGFSPNFCPYYSMTIWRLWAKKLINTILAEFDFFPSKNHDSIVFMQFC